jgi:propionyl-CoA synthetase
MGYRDTYRRALDDPETFWADAAEAIAWSRPWKRVLDASAEPLPRWFSGGRLNTCYNAVDRHVEAGAGDRPALVYDSPVTRASAVFTYAALRDEVARTAGMLTQLGVEKGDRVVLYMPMVPEAVFAMLACARIGAVHSVVFGGFAPRELAVRIDRAKPRVVLTASCGIEPSRVVAYKPLVDEAIGIARHAPETVVVLQREACPAVLSEQRDRDWATLRKEARAVSCVDVAATDPLYVLYTSGTTGLPKGVVRDHGGHAVALHWSLRNVYGMKPGEVFWAASDIGWVVGHSYIVYAPLLLGCTTILYEGKPVGTPDAGAYWRVAAEHAVDVLFTAPTALRAIKREDPEARRVGDHTPTRLRTLFLAGERADPDTVAWAERALGVPVIDHWWQTETGWPMAANCMGIEPLPVKHGSPTVPVPGFDVRVLDDGGAPLESTAPDAVGNIVVKLPLPPGCLTTLWEDDAGCERAYLERFPGYYQTGDAGRIDEDGYVWIMSRTDDIINVAGHRLSTGSMEEVLAGHRDVAECAVIGVRDAIKGQVPVGLVVLKAGVERPWEEIAGELVQRVRDEIGPVAAFKRVALVDALPKTRSGKILRGTMRKMADGEPWPMPATIEDPAVLDHVAEALGKPVVA